MKTMTPARVGLRTIAIAIMLSCTLVTGCGRPAQSGQEQMQAPPAVAMPPFVRLATCWAGQPLAQDLAAAFTQKFPGVVIDIEVGNSDYAASRLATGDADMAITIAPVDPLDSGTIGDWAEQRVLAIDSIGIIVHPDSPLEDLTMEQLRSMYAGYVVSWADLGGEDAQPEILTLPENSELRATFEDLVMEGTPITSAALLTAKGQDTLDYVASHPQAIGYLPMSHMAPRARLLTLDGLAPLAAQVRSGDYALSYRLVGSLAPEAPDAAKELFSLATSDAGREIVAEHYIPAN